MSAKSFPYRTAFIVNPYAGGKRGQNIWKTVESYLTEHGIKYEAYYTNNDAGDATRSAERACKEGAELIVGIGGDGTQKEIVNGIDLEKNILGVLSGGTANGFRRSLKIPQNPLVALKGLFNWPVIEMDLGQVNNTYFLNSVGMGYDARVSLTATSQDYWLKGYPGYVSACLQHAFYPPRPVTVQLDDDEAFTCETFLTLVANGRFYGGQMCIAPQARIDDGFLDFELVHPMSFPYKFAGAMLALARNHTWMKQIETRRIRRAVISCEDDTLPVQVDGETKNMERFPLHFQVHPKALKIISPLYM